MTAAATHERPGARGRARPAVPFLALWLGLSVLGWSTTIPAVSGWYSTGPRAEWSPAVLVFQVVWTVAYAAVALAGVLLTEVQDPAAPAGPALVLYRIGLVLHAVWLVAFLAQSLVGGDLLWLVLVVIVVLDGVTIAAAATAWQASRAASLLLWAVTCWLLFGTAVAGADTVLRGVLL